MKKSIGLMLACALVLTLGLGAWAAKPVVDANSATKVTGGGWYTADGDHLATEGNHCSLGFQAQQKGDGWSGTGSFMDRDYRLKAHLAIDDVNVIRHDLLFLTGTATVKVDNVSVGPCDFRLAVVDGAVSDPATDRVDFQITLPGPTVYESHGTLGAGVGGGQITFH